jgi:tetratricopeptide (TPR) repeat protein
LAMSLAALAALNSKREDFSGAEKLMSEAVLTLERTSGTGTAMYAAALSHLASLHRLHGNPSRAEPLLRKAAHVLTATVGDKHPYFATVLTEQGLIAERQRKFGIAERLFAQATRTLAAAVGPDSPVVATSEMNLARTLWRQQKLDEAKALVEHAVTVYGWAQNRSDASRLAIAHEQLARIHVDLRQQEKAEAHYAEAVQLTRNFYGPDHLQTGLVLESYAEVLKRARKPEARSVARDAKLILQMYKR